MSDGLSTQVRFGRLIRKIDQLPTKEWNKLVANNWTGKKARMVRLLGLEEWAKYQGLMDNMQDGLESKAVWHGSPHSFDSFSLDRIGSGEGQQAYGWGLYFTDAEDIAEWYADSTVKSKKNSQLRGERKFILKPDKDLYTELKNRTKKARDIWETEPSQWNPAEYRLLSNLSYWAEESADIVMLRKEYLKIARKTDGKIQTDTFANGFMATTKAKDYVRLIDSGNIIENKDFFANYNKNKYRITLHPGKNPEDYDYLDWDETITNKQWRKILARTEEVPTEPRGTRFRAKQWLMANNSLLSMINSIAEDDGKNPNEYLEKIGIYGMRYGTISEYYRNYEYTTLNSYSYAEIAEGLPSELRSNTDDKSGWAVGFVEGTPEEYIKNKNNLMLQTYYLVEQVAKGKFSDKKLKLKKNQIAISKVGVSYNPSKVIDYNKEVKFAELLRIAKILGMNKHIVDAIVGDFGGMRLYELLRIAFDSDKEASLFLLRCGIDGIQYCARGKRGTSCSDHNYVVFDEKAIQIDEHTTLNDGMDYKRRIERLGAGDTQKYKLQLARAKRLLGYEEPKSETSVKSNKDFEYWQNVLAKRNLVLLPIEDLIQSNNDTTEYDLLPSKETQHKFYGFSQNRKEAETQLKVIRKQHKGSNISLEQREGGWAVVRTDNISLEYSSAKNTIILCDGKFYFSDSRLEYKRTPGQNTAGIYKLKFKILPQHTFVTNSDVYFFDGSVGYDTARFYGDIIGEAYDKQYGLSDSLRRIEPENMERVRAIEAKADGKFSVQLARAKRLLNIQHFEFNHEIVNAPAPLKPIEADPTEQYETLPANFKNLHPPKLSHNDYSSWTEKYFIRLFYQSKAERIEQLTAKIAEIEEKLQAIKGQTAPELRQQLEFSKKDAKGELRELKAVAGKNTIMDQEEPYRSQIQRMVHKQWQDDGERLEGEAKEFVMNLLANRAINEEKVWEFYPTPYEVIDKMIAVADIKPGMRILEPSGGKGNILDKIYEKYGDTVRLETIELDEINRSALKLKGYKLIGTDFLQFEPEPIYDRILMNPPFKDFMDIDHVRHALKFLKPSGKLVCITSLRSIGSKATPKAIDFRKLIEDNGKIYPLAADVMQKAERAASVQIVLSMIDNSKLLRSAADRAAYDIRISSLEVGEKLVNITNDRVYEVKSTVPALVLRDVENGKERNFGTAETLIGLFRKFNKGEDDELLRRNGKSGSAGYRPINSGNPKDENYRKAGLVDARQGLSRTASRNRLDEQFAKVLMPHQAVGVNLALESMETTGSFLLADGTGAGKTFQQLGVAYNYIQKITDKAVCIISQADDILEQAFKGDANKLLSKTGIDITKVFVNDKHLLQNPDKFASRVEPGKIYLFKYKDFSLMNCRENPLRVKYDNCLKERNELRKQLQADITKIKLAGYPKKSEEEYIKGLREEFAKDAIHAKIVETESIWLDDERMKIGMLSRKFSAIIFDECHNLKNYLYYDSSENEQARRAVQLCENISARMFCSATPADRADAIFYLKFAGLFMSNQQMHETLMRIGFKYQEAKLNQFGKLISRAKYSMPKGKDRDATIAVRAIDQLFSDLTEEGRMLKREIEMNNITLDVVNVDTGKMAQIVNDKIMAAAASDESTNKAAVYMEQLRAVEPFKMKPAIDIAERELAAGHSVVIFTSLIAEDDKLKSHGGYKAGTTQDIYDAMCDKYGADKVAVVIGEQNPNFNYRGRYDRQRDIQDFQLNKKRILIATAASGGTGISLDDTDQYDKTGKLIVQGGLTPRTMIVLTAPMNAEGNVQMIGRINRANTMSRSKVYYLFDLSIAIEEWIANIVENKMRFLNAVVAGQTDKMNIKAMDKTDRTVDSEDDLEMMLMINNYKEDGEEDKKTRLRKHQFHDLRLLNSDTTGITTNMIAEWHDDDHRKEIILSVRTKARSTTLELYSSKPFFEKFGFELTNDRYTGTKIAKTFNKSDKDRINEAWNYICNLFLAESTEYIHSDKQLFEVGDKVRAVEDIIDKISGKTAKLDEQGTVINVRKMQVNAISERFSYDVDFGDGNILKRIEQYSLSKAGVQAELSFAEVIKMMDKQEIMKRMGGIKPLPGVNPQFYIGCESYTHGVTYWYIGDGSKPDARSYEICNFARYEKSESEILFTDISDVQDSYGYTNHLIKANDGVPFITKEWLEEIQELLNERVAEVVREVNRHEINPALLQDDFSLWTL